MTKLSKILLFIAISLLLLGCVFAYYNIMLLATVISIPGVVAFLLLVIVMELERRRELKEEAQHKQDVEEYNNPYWGD